LARCALLFLISMSLASALASDTGISGDIVDSRTNRIKVGGGGDDALKEWEISVLYEVRTLRTLSVKELRELPTDTGGYRLLKIPD
jgi:hypothetical protein